MFTGTGSNRDALTSITLPLSGRRIIRLANAKVRTANDIQILVEGGVRSSIDQRPFDGGKGIWTIRLEGSSVGIASLEAKWGNDQSSKISIDVVTKKVIRLHRLIPMKG